MSRRTANKGVLCDHVDRREVCVPGMEATMAEESSMHFYLNWAKERIDEMDATLASLEAKASQLQPDVNAKVESLVSDLKKRRDEFQATLKKQAEAGEAAWERAKAQLEVHMERLRSGSENLPRRRRQADRPAAGHLPGCCCGSNEGLARGGRQVPRRCSQSRNGSARRHRRSSQADES